MFSDLLWYRLDAEFFSFILGVLWLVRSLVLYYTPKSGKSMIEVQRELEIEQFYKGLSKLAQVAEKGDSHEMAQQ